MSLLRHIIKSVPLYVSRVLKNDGKTQGSAARINLMGFFKAWAGRLE
jgi:hypothetical protein